MSTFTCGEMTHAGVQATITPTLQIHTLGLGLALSAGQLTAFPTAAQVVCHHVCHGHGVITRSGLDG